MKTIQDALDHAGNTHSVDDVARQVLDGEAEYFAAERSGMVVEAVQYPLKKVARVWLAWGDMDEIRDDLKPRAEAWARDQGCDIALIAGRPGWAKALSDFRPLARILVKDLT